MTNVIYQTFNTLTGQITGLQGPMPANLAPVVNPGDSVRIVASDSGVSPTFLPAAALPTKDSNGAAFQGVVALAPGGAAVTPGRSLGFICTTAGNVTLTLADGSTLTIPIATANGAFQTLPFAVASVALSGSTAGSFWNLT